MPYHDPKRPMVRGWFSATKRSFYDCTKPETLRKLKAEHGCTVLYQYLHRYADTTTHSVDPRFAEAVERLTSDKSIWTRPAGTILSRLQQLQGLFCFFRHEKFWLVNTNCEPLSDVQVQFDRKSRITAAISLRHSGNTLVIETLPAQSCTLFTADKTLSFTGKRCRCIHKRLVAKVPFGFGRLYVNFSDKKQTVNGKVVEQDSFLLDRKIGVADFTPMSRIGFFEEIRCFGAQLFIIAREILFKGRKIDSTQFLGSDRIQLENHDSW